MHYHVRELEKFGFLRTTPPSELGQTVQGYLDEMKQEFMRAIAYGDAHPEAPFCFTWGSNSLWLTQEEFKTLEQQLETLFEPFRQPRGRAEERPWIAHFIAHPEAPLETKKQGEGASHGATDGI